MSLMATVRLGCFYADVLLHFNGFKSHKDISEPECKEKI